VQQADKVVLPWETTDSYHWKSEARLPGFRKPGNRAGKIAAALGSFGIDDLPGTKA
jgi:hypothetical protein